MLDETNICQAEGQILHQQRMIVSILSRKHWERQHVWDRIIPELRGKVYFLSMKVKEVVNLKLGGTSDKEARATTEKRQEEVAMIQDKNADEERKRK